MVRTCWLASHPRSFDRGLQIEIPAHIEALLAHKHQASQHRGNDRLAQAVPQSRELLNQVAGRGDVGTSVKNVVGALGTTLDLRVLGASSQIASHHNAAIGELYFLTKLMLLPTGLLNDRRDVFRTDVSLTPTISET